jgi:hypothetical protein
MDTKGEDWAKWEEKPVNKNQGWEPIHQKYKAKENTSKHNPKRKQKWTINKKSNKDPMQKGLMITKWHLIITKKT